MSNNKKEIATQLKDIVLSQPNLRHGADIADMFWLLIDEPDDYDLEAEVRDMIKNERISQGLTQVTLARRAGMAASNVNNFDNGTRSPHLKHLQKLAHGLGKRVVISFVDANKDETSVA